MSLFNFRPWYITPREQNLIFYGWTASFTCRTFWISVYYGASPQVGTGNLKLHLAAWTMSVQTRNQFDVKSRSPTEFLKRLVFILLSVTFFHKADSAIPSGKLHFGGSAAAAQNGRQVGVSLHLLRFFLLSPFSELIFQRSIWYMAELSFFFF